MKQVAPKDFKKLNKLSLKEGSITAREQKNFRANHDARLPIETLSPKRNQIPGPDFTFGMTTRP